MIRTNIPAAAAPRFSLGFSLMELLTVIATISILSMVAFPSFMQNVRESRRTDAQVALTRTSQNLERFFSTNTSYTTNPAQVGVNVNDGTAYSDNGDYVITIAAGPTGIGSSYVVTATAAADSMQAKDTGCTVLTLDSLGRRTPDPATTDCW